MVIKLENTADTGSNKPEKVHVKLISQAYSCTRPTKYNVSVLKPKIDRLAITFAVPQTADQACIREKLEQLSADANQSAVNPWKKETSWGAGKYARSFSLNVGDDNRALVQCTAGTTNIAFLRFEMNPDGIGPAGVMKFRKLLPTFTAGKVNYQDIAHLGKVTRADIAVDLVNIDLEDLLVHSSKPGVSNSYFGLGGKAETMYLNVNKRGSNLYVYDRRELLRKQQKDGKGPGSEYGETKLTRVEIRIQPNKPLTALQNLQNRLKRIGLIDIEAPVPPESEYHWNLFQDSCRYRGLAGALQRLPKDVRGSYEDAIKVVTDDLWRPEMLWSFWPNALEDSGLLP